MILLSEIDLHLCGGLRDKFDLSECGQGEVSLGECDRSVTRSEVAEASLSLPICFGWHSESVQHSFSFPSFPGSSHGTC